jgi:MFS family permease
MGISTFLIAFLPTYALIGWWAPALLCLLRFGQGFGLGGEWGGAALLAVENAPPGWRARFGIFPQLGAPVGFILANGLFLILGLTLSDAEFQSWGWRIPFLLSAVLVIVGLWVRLKLTETPDFKAMVAAETPAKTPFIEVFKTHSPQIIGGTFAAVACFAFFYIATAFALGYGTGTLKIPRETFLGMQLVAILFLAAGILISGYFGDKFSPRQVLITGCALGIPVGLLLNTLVGSGAMPQITLFLSLALFVMGLLYGPLGSWLPSLFPARVRYTGVSIAFNMGGIFGGALTPFAAQALADRGGLFYVGIYLASAAAVSLVALLLLTPEQASR